MNIRKAAFCLTVLGLLLSLAAWAHPFYVSITSIDYTVEKKQIEVSCRIFQDDLEKAIKNQLKVGVDVIKPKDREATNRAIATYIKQNFKITANGKPKDLTFVGYEIDNDVAWCYFKAPQEENIKELKVINQLLYQDFKTQANILHVTVNKIRKSTKLDNPKRSAEFAF